MAKKFHPHGLRTKLGITLQNFGSIINCSRSNLSMVETGKRKLTMEAVLICDLLSLALINAEKIIHDKPDNSDILHPFLIKQIKTLELKLKKLELTLTETQSKADALLLFIKTAEAFKTQSLPPNLEDTASQIEIFHRRGLKMYKNYLLKTSKMKISIAGINAKISNVQAQLKL